MKYNLIFTALLVFVLADLHAQENALYSQFTLNKYIFNPAVAGSENATMIRMAAYEQWVGFKGSPKYHSLSFDTRWFQDIRKPNRNIKKKYNIGKPGEVGFGVNFFNEKKGSLSTSGFEATYAYHIKFDNHQLSFGVSPVISQFSVNTSDVILEDDFRDNAIDGKSNKRWSADFNFGAYYSGKDFFAGYSIQHITASALQWGGDSDNKIIGRHHYLMGGYTYPVSTLIDLEGALLLKIPEDYLTQMDLSIKATIKKDYWCGIGYKTGRALSFYGGLFISRYYFGYAFDYNLSEVSQFSYGSHEIMLGVQLGDMTQNYRWLEKY